MNSRLFPAGPMPVAQRSGNGFVPVIMHPDHAGPERFPRKAKATLAEAIEYARCVLWWRQRRVAERRRKLAAISDPRWVEVVAEMNRHAKPLTVHRPVNRERTGFQGWEC